VFLENLQYLINIDFPEHYTCCGTAEYILGFTDYNFPEISIKTNNFILPLIMDIQN